MRPAIADFILVVGKQAFHVEYYDIRQRDIAFKALDKRSVLGASLRCSSRLSLTTEIDLASPPRSPTKHYAAAVPDSPSPIRRRDMDIAERKLFICYGSRGIC